MVLHHRRLPVGPIEGLGAIEGMGEEDQVVEGEMPVDMVAVVGLVESRMTHVLHYLLNQAVLRSSEKDVIHWMNSSASAVSRVFNPTILGLLVEEVVVVVEGPDVGQTLVRMLCMLPPLARPSSLDPCQVKNTPRSSEHKST